MALERYSVFLCVVRLVCTCNGRVVLHLLRCCVFLCVVRLVYLGGTAGRFLDEAASMLYMVVSSDATPPSTLFAPTLNQFFSIQGSQQAPVKVV